MPRYAFHQNTENLSSRDWADRSPYFKAAFSTIGRRIGAGCVVAGLTELKGEPRTLARQVPLLMKSLDAALDSAVVIAIQQSSGRGNPKEYIGIAYDSNEFTLLAAGSVWPSSTSINKWFYHNRPAANINRGVIDIPAASTNFKSDYRVVAYVAGQMDDGNGNADDYIFGFIHNDWGGGNRSNTFRNLALIADQILTATNNNEDDTFVLIGGDWNVAPADGGRGSVVEMKARYELDNNNQPVLTTAGSTYDFWMMNTDNVGFGDAEVHGETQNSLMSMHSAITLIF